MRHQDVIFTVSPVGSNLSVKMCYTCRSPEELICARGAIVDYLNTLYDKWYKEDHQNESADADKEKILDTIAFAIETAKANRDREQHSFAEGLINMAQMSGAISDEEYHCAREHWDSVKGFLYSDEGPEE